MQATTKASQLTNSGTTNSSLPLPSLLSQVLVAFTIEFDNEFERQLPHRTTDSKHARGLQNGPWLVSLVMWSNLMRHVPEKGITVAEVQRLARIAKLSLAGMERWGYIVVDRGAVGRRTRSSGRVDGPPRPDWVIRPTANGLKAQALWRALFGEIEKRWQQRFGEDEIRELRESLAALISRFDFALPDYLPVLGYGLKAEVAHSERKIGPAGGIGAEPHASLSALLSKVLLAFTMEFERESDLSLAICANVIRLLSEAGIAIRDLPLVSGVSKEAIKVAIGFLETRHFVTVVPHPAAARTKLAKLTTNGRQAQDAYRHRLGAVEAGWHTRFGKDEIRKLRESLERFAGVPSSQPSRLFEGLEPHPEGWRASAPRRKNLPHYPMVLHRGGYPDGS